MSNFLDWLKTLDKPTALQILYRCQRGEQHCDNCPALGCNDNLRVRELESTLLELENSKSMIQSIKEDFVRWIKVL